jgi:RNA polymerase sigma factor (sigma-70 family)
VRLPRAGPHASCNKRPPTPSMDGVSAEKQRKKLGEFLSTEWERLVSYVRSWLTDEADRDAEDIVQDVLAGIFERADVTAPIADLSAYVYRALHNKVVDSYRSRRRTLSLDAEDEEEGSLYDVVADLRFEASAEQESKELQEALFRAIENLPEEQQAVVMATELEGRKFRELSSEWKVPIGTLLARKHRAVKSLRAALAHHEQGGSI